MRHERTRLLSGEGITEAASVLEKKSDAGGERRIGTLGRTAAGGGGRGPSPAAGRGAYAGAPPFGRGSRSGGRVGRRGGRRCDAKAT